MKNEYRYINVHGTILYAEGHEVTRHKHGGEKMTMFRTEVMKQEYPAHWTHTEETVPADWKKRLNAEMKELQKAQKALDEIKGC